VSPAPRGGFPLWLSGAARLRASAFSRAAASWSEGACALQPVAAIVHGTAKSLVVTAARRAVVQRWLASEAIRGTSIPVQRY